MNSIAVMQPYFFPYIGYFQLIKEVDKFIFYDDVNYITGGWINRNRILINGEAKYLTIPCKNASQNRLIKDIDHSLTERDQKKLLKKIRFTYSNAPYFEYVFPIIGEVFKTEIELISELAIESIKRVADYLELECEFQKSSEKYDNQELDAADRLIDICKIEGINHYVNSIGGKELYDKQYFLENEVKLDFLEPSIIEYEQFNNKFIPGLSIIDVLMFNSISNIKNKLLVNYKLV
ncbi:WbqC family protein [Gracilimonas sediminicola]|uniref:WbqC family protein n=1 Tax=Gracilimonas sediminicola TaxID=2952158 RepID=UPI0038D466BE